MSLLQKASIITTPTAYAEDYLYSIKPAYALGSELIINGNFANGTTNWTATNAVISASDYVLTVDDSANAGGDSRATQSFTTRVGFTYKVRFNRVSTTSTFFLGIGGGPEGVLAASALDSFGCFFQGRFLFDTNETINRAKAMGIQDLKKKYELNEIVTGDSIFCATGITSGDLVDGISKKGDKFITHTLVTHKSRKLNKILLKEDIIKT